MPLYVHLCAYINLLIDGIRCDSDSVSNDLLRVA